ncbi:DUF6692 family protein [Rhizobium halophilum]|uniref:DUF6692 family protein n=1 Tax=Rhizobium halophilum TaxID=2846852 RepID=UPI001EFD55D1|nr:DUF6692 family protein [Rhizobium halophilum]MCF6369958.1 hypothetical protein [Rhizobium halophilum]
MMENSTNLPIALAALVAAATLLSACGDDVADDVLDPRSGHQVATVVPASAAIANAVIGALDPATMVDAEMQKVLGGPATCSFHYTSFGQPVAALRADSNDEPASGVVKLNGHLIEMQTTRAEDSINMTAGDIRLAIAPQGDGEEAKMVFEIGQDMKVGYRGYYRCARPA